MRSAILKLTVLALGLLEVAAARGQTAPPPAAPARLQSTVVEALPSNLGPAVAQVGLASGQAQPEAVATPAPDPNAIAVPPPEPQLPKWGDYSQPRPAPIAFPSRLYDLIGPPRGWIQPNSGQRYQGVIADPNGLPALDLSLTMGIDLSRPDGLAPMGVFGDNTLRAGQILFSARYGQGVYEQNYIGTRKVTPQSILAGFPFAPRRMLQQTEYAVLEYAPSEDLTLMFTLPFQQSRLDYVEAGGGASNAVFGNPGDIKVTALYVLYREPGRQLHANLGVSVPTGFLDYQTDQPSQTFPNLPYMIRTSSGSYDLMPGLTYRGQSDLSTWGSQVTGTIRTGLNRAGYELGDQIDLTAWWSVRWTPRLATSARIDGQSWGNVRQSDPRLNQSLSPVNVPGLQGGSRINLLLGFSYYLPQNRVPGQIFSVEAGVAGVSIVERSAAGSELDAQRRLELVVVKTAHSRRLAVFWLGCGACATPLPASRLP